MRAVLCAPLAGKGEEVGGMLRNGLESWHLPLVAVVIILLFGSTLSLKP
ncbi:hypothetical protein [Streptomyces sp. NPDC101234]